MVEAWRWEETGEEGLVGGGVWVSTGVPQRLPMERSDEIMGIG